MIDDEDVQAQNDALKVLRDQQLDDIRLLLLTLHGQRFFLRLLTEGNVFRSTFSTDTHASAFNEGQRNFALKIFNDIVQSSPESVPVLLTRREDIAE